MLEMGTSGLMSGVGKRDDASASAPALDLDSTVDVLGFENADWGTEDFTSISRDRAAIYLCRGDQGRGGAWVWIGVEAAQKVHAELTARGVTIREGPTNYPWALEFRVEDPDGNVIRFGSEPL